MELLDDFLRGDEVDDWDESSLNDKPVRIFYFYTHATSSIQNDLEILRSRHTVNSLSFPSREKWKIPFLLIQQIFFLIKNAFFENRYLIIIQSTGYHSLIPCIWARLSGHKSIILVEDSDCVAFPSLGYGRFQNLLSKHFACWSFELVHAVVAGHKSMFLRDNLYAGTEESSQGILNFMPNVAFERNVIPGGFDPRLFRVNSSYMARRPLSFICISDSNSNPVLQKINGIDLVIELANRFPRANFTIAGGKKLIVSGFPSNVEILDFISSQDMPSQFNRHRFYIQLSISEGFPNALCEAMACGCVPVVSEVGGMPEIVQSFGGIAGKMDSSSIDEAVRDAVRKSERPGMSADISRSVSKRYPLERRRRELLLLIENIA
jgi:glycosyltransferase involved in cell wall biosynthesis